MRASPVDVFFSVALPQARRGFLAAAILVFAHTVGEFGVVLMIGGSIPGRTQVVSIRIYELVEALKYDEAHLLAGGLVLFAFLVMLSMLLILATPIAWWLARSRRWWREPVAALAAMPIVLPPTGLGF